MENNYQGARVKNDPTVLTNAVFNILALYSGGGRNRKVLRSLCASTGAMHGINGNTLYFVVKPLVRFIEAACMRKASASAIIHAMKEYIGDDNSADEEVTQSSGI